MMPDTADELGVKDSFDPEENIRGGVKYFKDLLDKFENIRITLGAYNWGPENVIKRAKKQESKFPKGVREHIDRVLEFREICKRKHSEYYEEK